MINLVEWKDRIVEKVKTFYVRNNDDGTITLVDAPGTVAEAGTPVSAGNMNALRDGILQATPVSAVMHFARLNAPDGWLICDGTAILRTTYADLFNAIGTTFGAGNGSTTFNLPDLRGEFIRGFDGGKGVDTGRVFGTKQEGTVMSKSGTGSRYVSGGDTFPDSATTSGGSSSSSTSPAFMTRPRNIALLPCIKY